MEKIVASLPAESPGAKKILTDVSKIRNEASTSTTAELYGQRINRTKPKQSAKKVLDTPAHSTSLLNDTAAGTSSSQNFIGKSGLVDKNLIPPDETFNEELTVAYVRSDDEAKSSESHSDTDVETTQNARTAKSKRKLNKE